MRHVFAALCLSVALAGCGSSTSVAGTGTLPEACESLGASLCNRFFACDSAAADIAYGTASQCASQFNSAQACSTAACGTGLTYNAANAQTCINDVDNLPCSDFTGGTPTQPTSCNTSNICQ